jgi:putative transposase
LRRPRRSWKMPRRTSWHSGICPLEHQRQLHSTNTLGRQNKEIKRRSNVVGVFPNPPSVIRLVGAVLLEQDDEWALTERRYLSAESMKQTTTPALLTTTPGDSHCDWVAAH